MTKKFYVTTAIPYVNAAPHIGHALEFVHADTIARFHKYVEGASTLLLSGADENALKNVQAAERVEKGTQAFIDENAVQFQKLAAALNVDFGIFQKGSDQTHHFPACQKLWQLCDASGDIYKKSYEGLYCVGCESFYTKEELDQNGECFEHPGKKLESVSEENYFFRLSKYTDQIRELIEKDTLRIIPQKRKNEVLSFLKENLEDISISRSNERAKNWGVPVPKDPSQRMYVWFDALNIYQSGIGFGWDEAHYAKWWPADIHVIGKGIIRFHAIYWPAFLLSAKLQLPKALFVHEYFTVNGQKMSKSLGNVVDPFTLIERYGCDGLRYFLLAAFSPFNDGDFSEDKCRDLYNADLANGLGNLAARVAAMSRGFTFPLAGTLSMTPQIRELFTRQYEFDRVLAAIWEKIKACDTVINEKRIWKLEGEEKRNALLSLIISIRQIAIDLTPFLPQTAEKILKQFSGATIAPQPSLFPRLS